MTAHLPHVVVGGRGRLVDVARPACRPLRRQVFLGAAGWMHARTAVALAEHQLAAHTGPARCSEVTVEVVWGHEAAVDLLARPEFRHLSAAGVTIALAGYDAALATLGHAAFLLASCVVLWPQTEPLLGWNLS